jgi:hypothetical protein
MLSFKRTGTLAAGLFVLAAAPAHATEFPVINASSGGAGSLRSAINSANQNPGRDDIVFEIPGNGVHVIALNNALPVITGPVTIDGYTQGGSVEATATAPAHPTVVLDATNVNRGLDLGGDRIEVRGLTVRDSNGDGIVVEGSENVIAGNHVGTNSAGDTAQANAGYGVVVIGGTGNLIGGPEPEDRNVISSNVLANVHLEGGDGQRVESNYLGVDASGTAGLGGSVGVLVGTDDNVVTGNVASFTINGLTITGSDNTVQGNHIGTDVEGEADLGNFIGVNVGGGDRNLIEDNVVSGNVFEGVGLRLSGDDPAEDNEVRDNLIGTDADGVERLANGTGVSVFDVGHNTLDGNVIAASVSDGVLISGAEADSNVVEDNWIGTDAGATLDLGNGQSGVEIVAGGDNRIGKKLRRGVSNVIAFNAKDGVTVTSGVGNAIVGNSIRANGELGIDLADDGPTANDGAGDDDSGPNTLQNGPDVDEVTASTVEWEFESEPDTDYRLEFFASDECDPSGSGEGQDYLGFVDVRTDNNGEADDTSDFAVGAGRHVTMTATRLNASGRLRSTSEFSPCELTP